MSRVLVATLALAACHHTTTAPDTTVANDGVAPVDEVFVDARTLLVDGPTATTPRVQLARFGTAQLALDGETIEDGEAAEWFDTLAVAETRGSKLRVRYDELGDASLLLWIDRADLKPVIAQDAAVAIGPGDPFPERDTPGVWLLAGTVPDQIAPAADGSRRAISVDVDDLLVTGEIETSRLGELWIPPPPAAERDDWAWIDAGTPLRVAPDLAAPVVATTTGTTEMVTLLSKNGWTEVASMGAHVRAVGYVADGAIVSVVGGLGSRDGATRAHAAGPNSVKVPAGACLYDRRDGALAGVALATYARDAQDLGGGWHEVLAGSAWGAFSVAVQQVDGAIELCVSDR